MKFKLHLKQSFWISSSHHASFSSPENFKQRKRIEIPIYQRTYSWTEKECRQLWEDILRCGKNDAIQVHFVGSIVYVESLGLSQVTHLSPLLVIDGQQRLTTVTLLLAALAEVAGEQELFDGFTARKIRNYYLLNPEEDGERHFKLLLSQTDKETLKALVAPRNCQASSQLESEKIMDCSSSGWKNQERI